MNDEVMLLLGRLEGQMNAMSESQTRMETTMTGMDARLRMVEISGAKSGAVAGGLAAVLMAASIEFIKSKLLP